MTLILAALALALVPIAIGTERHNTTLKNLAGERETT